MGTNRTALICALALAASISAPGRSHGQGLSATIALGKPFYWGGDFSDTQGDWQAEVTARYHFDGPFRIGIGLGGGKFDEPFSDPSFSSLWLYVEPSLRREIGARLQTWLGARYGWTHERVGDRDGGLWAWGWLGGAGGGMDYALSERVGVGIQVDVMHLDLRRDEDGALPPGGLDREGWRWSVGPVLKLGGG
jgi:hypothetical protein